MALFLLLSPGSRKRVVLQVYAGWDMKNHILPLRQTLLTYVCRVAAHIFILRPLDMDMRRSDGSAPVIAC